jgi:hypothetical protein
VLAVGCWLLAIGYWLLAIGYWLLADGNWLFAALARESIEARIWSGGTGRRDGRRIRGIFVRGDAFFAILGERTHGAGAAKRGTGSQLSIKARIRHGGADSAGQYEGSD